MGGKDQGEGVIGVGLYQLVLRLLLSHKKLSIPDVIQDQSGKIGSATVNIHI